VTASATATSRSSAWDPLTADTDYDGLADGAEIARGLDPRLLDSDNDGLTDGFADYDGSGLRVEWPPDAYSYGYDRPYIEPAPDEVSARPVRHVNVRVAAVGGDPVVERPLPAGTDLEVLCSVGAFDPHALTAGAADAAFPDEFSPTPPST
jgi:hypothetical protein